MEFVILIICLFNSIWIFLGENSFPRLHGCHRVYVHLFLCLQDAGYGEKSLFSCDDDNDDSESKNIDDEVMSEILDFDKPQQQTQLHGTRVINGCCFTNAGLKINRYFHLLRSSLLD